MATTNLRTYEPYADLVRMNPLFDLPGWFDMPARRMAFPSLRIEPEIKMDVTEDATAYHVKAEIPGVKKDDIHVLIEGNTVSVSAEVTHRKESGDKETMLCSELYEGKASRTFTLMSEVDETKAAAKYENGILELTLPKKAGARSKALSVQ